MGRARDRGRLDSGGGHTVDVSLFETAMGLLPYQVTAYLAGGAVPGLTDRPSR